MQRLNIGKYKLSLVVTEGTVFQQDVNVGVLPAEKRNTATIRQCFLCVPLHKEISAIRNATNVTDAPANNNISVAICQSERERDTQKVIG